MARQETRVSLRYALRSDVGMLREGNEDSGYAGPRLVAVADGMGGAEGGEVASAAAIDTLRRLDTDIPVPDLLSSLEHAVQEANGRLRSIGEGNPSLRGMGTTLTAMLWNGSHIALAHIGETRAYLLRNGELFQITHDHTLVQSLVDEGRISLDEAATHPQRSLLLRALDGRAEVEPDLSLREADLGDRYLISTDGLFRVVSAETIHQVLSTTVDPKAAVGRLIDLANRGGGPDNITCLIADVVEAGRLLNHRPVVAGAATNAANLPQPGDRVVVFGAPQLKRNDPSDPLIDLPSPDEPQAERVVVFGAPQLKQDGPADPPPNPYAAPQQRYDPYAFQAPPAGLPYDPYAQQQPAAQPPYSPYGQREPAAQQPYDPYGRQEPAALQAYDPYGQQEPAERQPYDPYGRQEPAAQQPYDPYGQQGPAARQPLDPYGQREVAERPSFDPHGQRESAGRRPSALEEPYLLGRAEPEEPRWPAPEAAEAPEAPEAPRWSGAGAARAAAPTGRRADFSLDGYEVFEALGSGGNATVYRGRRTALGRDVAIKVVDRRIAGERDVRRFRREVDATVRLSEHPNVVTLYDADTLPDDRPYMVMELCPAGSLADRLHRDGPMTPAYVRDVGVQVADAVAAAHEHGVLHRDIKPANLLLTRFGRVALADFGIAALPIPGQDLSITLAMTPAYAAPEVFDDSEPSPAGDVYSLGATLYSLLAGRAPRSPDRQLSPTALIAHLLRAQNTPINPIPGVPPALLAVLRRSLEADPASRHHSAAELRDALIAVRL